MEELLDQAYESFVARKEGSTKQRKRAKKAYSDDAELLEVLSSALVVLISNSIYRRTIGCVCFCPLMQFMVPGH